MAVGIHFPGVSVVISAFRKRRVLCLVRVLRVRRLGVRPLAGVRDGPATREHREYGKREGEGGEGFHQGTPTIAVSGTFW